MNKKTLLKTPHWNYKAVMFYCEVGITKAYEIMALCRKKYNGTIKDMPSHVKRDGVLAMLGTNALHELEIIYMEERREYEKLHERNL